MFTLDDWFFGFDLSPRSITTTRGRIYNPQTHDIVPKKEYIQDEIDRLSKSLKQAEDNEKEQKKYWRERQTTIKGQIAELTEKLKD